MHHIVPKYIIDTNAEKAGKEMMGIPIVNKSSMGKETSDYKKIKVIIAAPKYKRELEQESYESLGEIDGVYSFEGEIYYTFIKDIEEYRNFIIDSIDRIIKLNDMLADQKSKDTLSAVLKGRITADQNYFINCMVPDQYFPKDIISLSDNEVVVEVGSNDGETLKEILANTKGLYSKIYCLEPDDECVRALKKITATAKNISIIEKGAWSKSDSLYFNSTDHGASKIVKNKENADYSIDVVALDDIIEEKVTYIKMDIEGSELEALKGAEGIIRRDKPKLAICIYHNKEDIVAIAEYIHEIVPDYKFYMRHHNWGATETVLYAIVN